MIGAGSIGGSGGEDMPRIALTIPIMPGKQEQVVKLLHKYKAQLDKAHEAVGATQWLKFVDRDEYVEVIDWAGKTFLELLREYMAHPEMKDFLGEMVPSLMVPAAPEGVDEDEYTAIFLEGRAMNQAYAQKAPPA
jgi:hypothetical protein